MKNRLLIPLFGVMFLDLIAYTVRYPVFTLAFYDIGSRLFAVDASMVQRSYWYGVCISIYLIATIISAPILSLCSDHIGRKTIILVSSIGSLSFAFFSGLGIITGHLLWLIVGGVIGGLCSRMDPIAQAMVGDITQGKDKILYMGYLQFAISSGAFLGPLLGGQFVQGPWSAHLSFSLPFWIATVLALIAVAMSIFWIKETAPLQSKQKVSLLAAIREVLCNPVVLRVSLLLALVQLSWSTYYQFIGPILKQDYHASGKEIGAFIAMVAVFLALAASIGVRWLRRYLDVLALVRYSAYAILFGLFGSVIITLFHEHVQWRWLLWVFAAPIAGGDVIIYSVITALYSDAVSGSAQGKVMGACFVIVQIMWAIAAMCGGFLIGINVMLPLWFALICILTMLLIFYNMQRYFIPVQSK